MTPTSPSRIVRLLALSSVLSCVGGPIPDLTAVHHSGGVSSILVTVSGNIGSVASPLPYAATGVPFAVRVEADGADGSVLTSFNGYFALSVTPGVVDGLTGPTVLGNYVRLTNGVADGINVVVSQAFGEVRVLASDSGYVPVDPRRSPPPQCANGIDDNHNGLTDYPADPGCAAANDDTEDGGSYVVGSSQPIFFDSPLISDVTGHAATSPLVGDRVSMVGRSDVAAPTTASPMHRLVVTNTDNSGFYVTDIDDTSCMGMPCYNSIYAYNYNPPVGMYPCDMLSSLVGSVSVFVSYNELNEPGYIIGMQYYPPVDPAHPAPAEICRIPDAVVLDATAIASTPALSALESGMVRVTDVSLPTIIGPAHPTNGVPTMGATNCDFNNDGKITYNGGPEQQCADMCLAEANCSEWSGWLTYGQIYVTLSGATASRILVTPKTVLPDFDPQHPVGLVATVTGELRRVGPDWVIAPRCQEDMVIQGDGQSVRAANATCLPPRTGSPASSD